MTTQVLKSKIAQNKLEQHLKLLPLVIVFENGPPRGLCFEKADNGHLLSKILF
jgi:hypothetical protein